ncbi:MULTISPECIES: GIY-YIG nuclease family protein [Flavobacterium]|uniref:GIY-YIG nuclease family protein n=1 Tax=Flavobacterium hankyongi TaxID=1176532 RepID=A0ABP8ZNZ0_9FLAO|nr:GIY-YIG nuclease family protein [Flavobacterium sp. N1846]
MKLWYIYIMTNKPNGVIYVGVTDNLLERVKEHKLKVYPNSFTAKYNCDKLVYFEEWKNGFEATMREKQLKKWKRDWKLNLIKEMNPTWLDISINWNFNFNKIRE